MVKKVALLAAALVLLFGDAVAADLAPSWSPKSLREQRTLATMPDGVKAALSGMSDRDGPFNPSDNLDGRPTRRFIVGGTDATSAFVAFEKGGIAQIFEAVAFVRVNDKWTQINHWYLAGSPSDLRDALRLRCEMGMGYQCQRVQN